METQLIKPLIGPWKAILRSIDLRPIFASIVDPHFINFTTSATHTFIRSLEDGTTEHMYLWIKKSAWEDFLKAAYLLWKDKLDEKFINSLVKEELRDWVISQSNSQDFSAMLKSLQNIVKKVEVKIKPVTILVPLRGITLPDNFSYSFKDCLLLPHQESSLLKSAIEEAQKRFRKNKDAQNRIKDLQNADSVFCVKFIGHEKRGYTEAIIKAQDLIDVLRLYLASNYIDINNGFPLYSMGIVGYMPVFEPKTFISIYGHTLTGKLYPGFTSNENFVHSYSLGDHSFNIMEQWGFTNLLDIFERVRLGIASNLETRISRAVIWFAKGTRALNKDDSHISYAIAIESLLSAGKRHSQSSLSTQIAALLATSQRELYSVGGRGKIGKSYGGPIRGTADIQSFHKDIKIDLKVLFQVRHDLVHGNKTFSTLDHKLLWYFETFVRNTILLFIAGGWTSLDDFEKWRKQEFPDTQTNLKRVQSHLRDLELIVQNILDEITKSP